MQTYVVVELSFAMSSNVVRSSPAFGRARLSHAGKLLACYLVSSTLTMHGRRPCCCQHRTLAREGFTAVWMATATLHYCTVRDRAIEIELPESVGLDF